MDYKNTNLFFLEKNCIDLFGIEKGMKIYHEAREKLHELLEKADFRNSKSIQTHMETNMLPAIAFYQVLLENGYEKEVAYEYTLSQTQISAEIKKEKTAKLKKIPFVYSVFRMAVKPFMKKNFPKEGWETQWVRNDAGEIHFNLQRCVYFDTAKELGCPEICSVFCKNDDTSFAGFEPKIEFFRINTLADGGAFCDFHFRRGKAVL